MTEFRKKISKLFLFLLGILWGYLWVLELLSCPEWWFISSNALLVGTGIFAIKKLPDYCRRMVPALLVLLLFCFFPSDLQSILLPFFFGCWYGGESEVFCDWKSSRTFCGGILFGGIFAGIGWLLPFWSDWRPFIVPLLIALVLINSVFRESLFDTLGMVFLSIFFIWCSLPQSTPVPEAMDTGTVLAALSLVEFREEGQGSPKISFIGDRNPVYDRIFEELYLDSVCRISRSKLPGTVSAGTDLIIVTELPETGDRGIAALRRALRKNAVLVMPSCYWELFPGNKWHILPGSDGEYAATSMDRELDLDPDKMDLQLAGHFRTVKTMAFAPLPGAFAGMLIDFKPQSRVIAKPEVRNFSNHLISGALALAALLMIWVVREKRQGSECFRVILNSSGYAMLAGLFLPVVFRELPTGDHFRAICVVSALVWIFRRPVPDSKKRFWLSGVCAAGMLAASYFFRNIYFMMSALIAGGYFFAVLDGELCVSRDNETEALRFLGFAAGAFVSGVIIAAGIPWYLFFLTVMVLRGWSWLRN